MSAAAGALLLEADDASRRAAAGLAAGREVSSQALTNERDATQLLLRRLQQLKRELQGVIAAAAGDGDTFRGFTAASLISSIDELVAHATVDLTRGMRSTFTQAFDLGAGKVDAALDGARISLTTAPRIDRTLIQHAFDTNAELLTAAMQQFRNQVVQGVRRAAVAGSASFDQLRALAGSIDKQGFDNAAFKAERIMRTELGRVLNGATFDRLAALAATLPFLRKGWRAAKDGRTRRGHVEAAIKYARGKGIPVLEPFVVNVYSEFPGRPVKLLGVAQLRYPIDPDTTPAGRIAAGATIMCRCNAFVDFDLAEMRTYALGGRSRPVSPGVPGFAEPPVGPRPAPAPQPKPPAPRRTAAETRAELGRLFGDREATHKRLAEEFTKTGAAAYRANAAMLDAVEKYGADSPQARAAAEAHQAATTKYRKAGAALESNELRFQARSRKAIELPAGERSTIKFTIAEDAEFFRGVSRKYGPGDKVTSTYEEAAAARLRITQAIDVVERIVGSNLSFGKVIVDNARDARTGEIPFNPRAYAVEEGTMGTGRPGRRGNSINLSPWESPRVVAHELGHLLEFNNPNVREAALNFLERRTRGEQSELLSKLVKDSGYESYERARPDKFRSPYIGKDYGAARWTEVVSMGLEYMFTDPAAFAREDPEMFDFIYDLLRGYASGGRT